MATQERLSNLGYLALGKESVFGTAVIPSIFVPMYKETLNTGLNLDELEQITGTNAKYFQAVMGMRSHEGVITVQAEPNTSEYIFDMFLKQGSITGANPYTHPFTLADSNGYTLDILRGQIVHRYFGVKAQSLDITFNKDEMRYDVDVSALHSFSVRKIATVNTTTITLDTGYDPAPNNGLVATDLVRIMKADGSTTLDTTVSSVNADGITVVLGASAAAYAAGDFIFLRQQTASYSLLPPFLWATTQFCFAATASSALTTTQTRMEQGTKYKLMYSFEKKQGADRSGAFDPANLVRTTGEAVLTAKVFFDQPQDLARFLSVSGYACVIRHYVTSGANTYELRITLNNIIQKTSKRPLDVGKIVYNEIEYDAFYNTSDGQVMDVKVLNAIAT